MTFLIFEPSKPKRSGPKKPLKFILGIGALVGIMALGSTLAASINLNNNDPVEFGQGVAQTVACSGNDSVIVTPTSKFVNASGAGAFYFTSVTLSDIPSSCDGTDFTITAYDQAGDSIALTSTNCISPGYSGDKPVVHFQGEESATTENSYDEMYSEVTQADSSSFTLTWHENEANGCESAALAGDVYRITIESSGGESVPETSFVFNEKAGPLNRNWNSIASSSDGVMLVASERYGYLYTSSNSGATWVQRTYDYQRDWRDVASSSDGTKLVAIEQNNGWIYTSSDSGATWTQQLGAGPGDWNSVASSNNGENLVAARYDGRIWTSSDSGVSWNAGPQNGLWTDVASSGDGTKLVAVEYWEDVQGYIWTSENAGVTWTKRTSAGGKSWSQVTSSGDGTKIFALSDNSDGKIYKSSDSGDTWTESSGPSGLDADLYNYDISSSSNGKYLVVSNANGYLYTSNDSGATWIKQTSALSDFYWVEMSRNGKSIAAPIYGGLIWTGIRD